MGYYPEFAALLDQNLADTDHSAAWLAQRLKVNPGTVTRWRNGDTRPNSPEVVIQIADILGIYDQKDRQRLLHAAGYGYLVNPPDLSFPTTTPPSSEIFLSNAATTETAAETSKRSEPKAAVEWKRVSTKAIATTSSTRIVHHPFVRIILIAGIVVLLALTQSASQPLLSSQPIVYRFAIRIGEGINASGNELDQLLGDGTRRVLYQKLSLVPSLQGMLWGTVEVAVQAGNSIDYQIILTYQRIHRIRLIAEIYGRQNEYLTTVEVQGKAEQDGAEEICYIDLQNQLAERILEVLKVSVPAETAGMIDNVPTTSCDALKLNNRAAQLILEDKISSAQDLLSKALQSDPHYADACNNLGQTYYHQQNWAEAIRWTRQAIDLLPDNAIYSYNLGLILEQAGSYDDAVAAYQQAIALDPLYIEARNNLGFTWLEMDKIEKAAEILAYGLELAPDAPYLYKNMGRVHLAQGDAEKAISSFQQAILLSPDSVYPEATYYLALANNEVGKTQEACQTLLRYAVMSNQDEPIRSEQAEKFFADWQCASLP